MNLNDLVTNVKKRGNRTPTVMLTRSTSFNDASPQNNHLAANKVNHG
jgi:hypothetical protein